MKAVVKKIDKAVEEEVLLSVSNVEITAFIGYSNFKISEETEYEVELSLMMFDDIVIKESNSSKKQIIRLDDSFRHRIIGILKEDGILDASIQFRDEIFLEFPHLIGKFIELEVDRIDASFESS